MKRASGAHAHLPCCPLAQLTQTINSITDFAAKRIPACMTVRDNIMITGLADSITGQYPGMQLKFINGDNPFPSA